jgi:subtilisin-like proprotein convertase family protein
LVAAFQDTGSAVETADHFTGFARSTDGGATWSDLGALPGSRNGDAGFPSLARSPSTGTIVLATEGWDSRAVIQVFRSTSDGASFAAPANGAPGGGDLARPWVAADHAAGTGRGYFYLTFHDLASGGGILLTRSTDDGATWTDQQLLSTGADRGSRVVVGPDHAVYVFWLSGTTLTVRKSSDLGLTFAPPVAVATVLATSGGLGLDGGFEANVLPQVVASPIDPLRLYAVFADRASAGPDKANVYITQTADGGATWSARQQVNSDSGTNDNWGPVIAILPDGSGLFVSWYDRRLDASNALIDVYGRNATIAGSAVTFGTDYRITEASFPAVVAQDPILYSHFMGDYDMAVADATAYYRTWGDNRLAQGTHAHQPDVRFAAIPRDGPGPVLAPAGATVAAESCAPVNHAIEPGEAVVLTLGLTNFGSAAPQNLVGTLEATGGVSFPSGPQSFGAVAPGSTAVRAFDFTAAASCGGALTATLRLQDGAMDLGTATFHLVVGAPLATPLEFSSTGGIFIRDLDNAFPYPSSLTVSGFTGAISRATVTLHDLTHTFPADIDVLLVGPGGQKALVMSDLGAGDDVGHINLTFDDLAASAPGAALTSGTFRPTSLDDTSDLFAAPAPPPPYSRDLAAFTGLSGSAANGVWSLYIRDDAFVDSGTLGGWTLSLYGFSCSTSCAQTVPMRYFTLPPCRLVDTRSAAGSFGGPALQAGTDRSFTVSGACGIPPEAQALALNVTVVDATSGGHLRLFAGSTPRPSASAINFQAGQTRANNAVAALGTGGVLTIFDGQPSGSVHCLLDVSGYFAGWP